MIQNQKMVKNLILGLIYPRSAQIRAAKSFFFFFLKNLACQSIDIIVSYHHVQYKKKN